MQTSDVRQIYHKSNASETRRFIHITTSFSRQNICLLMPSRFLRVISTRRYIASFNWIKIFLLVNKRSRHQLRFAFITRDIPHALKQSTIFGNQSSSIWSVTDDGAATNVCHSSDSVLRWIAKSCETSFSNSRNRESLARTMKKRFEWKEMKGRNEPKRHTRRGEDPQRCSALQRSPPLLSRCPLSFFQRSLSRSRFAVSCLASIESGDAPLINQPSSLCDTRCALTSLLLKDVFQRSRRARQLIATREE